MTNNTGKKITVFETKSSSEESFSDNLLEDGDAVKNKEERTLYYTVKENDKLDVKVGLEDQDKTFVFKDVDTTDTKKVDVSLKDDKVNLDVTKKDGTTATLTPSEDSAKTEEEKKKAEEEEKQREADRQQQQQQSAQQSQAPSTNTNNNVSNSPATSNSSVQTQQPSSSTPVTRDYLFSQGYDMSSAPSACQSALMASGRSGSCTPLQDSNGIYLGMRLVLN